MLDFEGRPLDARKRIYGQAFAVYALAEYFHASADAQALTSALSLVNQIESSGHDAVQGATSRPMSATGPWPWTSG